MKVRLDISLHGDRFQFGDADADVREVLAVYIEQIAAKVRFGNDPHVFAVIEDEALHSIGTISLNIGGGGKL
jgi:hypothetical protein